MDVLDVDSGVEMMDIDIDYLSENVCSNYVYVDVQGFRTTRNRFICKEFCLVDGYFMFHTFVKSPYSFDKMSAFYQRQAKYLINHIHGIKYDYGETNIIELKQKMYAKVQNKTILVRGNQKIAWLKYIFRDCGEINCLNIYDLNFDLSLKKNYPYDVCEYHNRIFDSSNGPCAMSNALMLQDLTNKNSNVLNNS